MKFHFRFPFIAIAFMLLTGFKSKSQSIDPGIILQYSQTEFDSDTCCWRKLSRAKKHKEAAQLVSNYLKTNKKIENRHSLNWHAGQLYAMAGDNKLAKKYFKKTYTIFTKWFGGEDGQSWYYFAKGNIAFLDRDKNKFQTILDHWKQKYPIDRNYKALLDLYNYWDSPYGYAINSKQ